MKKQIAVLALSIGAFTSLIIAQDGKPGAGGPPPGGQDGPGGRGGGPGGPGGQRPPSPIIEALDLNKNGVIDADELAKAEDSLKKLDKNADGKLTEEEFRPPRPGGPGGPGGQGGPGGGGQGGPGAGGKGGPGGAAPGGAPQRPALEK
jgi:hypothetical protein